MPTRRHVLLGTAALALLPPGARAADPVQVVASFSILADLVREVGAERVRIDTLVGPDQDAHAFQPTPGDARRIAAARVVVLNGLGFEGWMTRLIRAANFQGTEIVASRGIRTLRARHAHAHGHGHGHGETDPHIWQDPKRAQVMVRRIAAGLAAADPAGKAAYEANAARYNERLEALHAWVEAQYADIPRAQRRVVTSHDAFAYYGERYGIDFLAAQGVTTRGEPSAAGIARLVQQIRRERIRAIFIEGMANPRILEQVAAESGARVGGTLYSDALSPPDGPAPTYEAMIRTNTARIAAALAG
ncbi:metal ABC transporter substrate-binding protein [Elioraea sp. Yellowstone]|jgi:zinc/manganese transport system substrate-binding protein|uniref:metal ABC transporter solute-binding protein, Zn/Mn family n=1 Tax=Elioraea sp. Yellowstone TaxID=2592070 RepID=UPI00114F4F48|nr:zinc ABC transporter substrate-binding protein [Elioraea sp. Yellowstone]TQF77963.1 metal ABC transporter substrate-binding protein [Elioraea sp. Yellowstone]